MSNIDQTSPISIKNGQNSITHHSNASVSTVNTEHDSDVDALSTFSRSPTGSTVQSASTTRENGRTSMQSTKEVSRTSVASFSDGPSVRYGRGLQRPSIVSGDSLHSRRQSSQSHSQQRSWSEEVPRPRGRSPYARYGRGLQRPSTRQWEGQGSRRHSFRGTVQDMIASSPASLPKEKSEERGGDKRSSFDRSHQNVYTHAGRHSDDWLFGGWSITGSLKKVFAKKE